MADNNALPLLETRRLSVSIGERVFCRDLDVQLHAGEVRKFRIANSESGLYLMPVASGS